MRPLFDKKLIMYIDDLNLAGDQNLQGFSSLELIRQYLTQSGWFNPKSKRFMKVNDLAFFATLTL